MLLQGSRHLLKKHRAFLFLTMLLVFLSSTFPVVAADSSSQTSSTDSSSSSLYSCPYTIKTFTLEGAEGARLPAHIYIPKGDPPEGGFPAIIFIHSWCLNQWEYDAQMIQFASQGYVTLCYNCRGWYFAGGKIGVAGPLEMQDLNRAFDWLIANAPVNPQKVGVCGISYGGGQSLLALKFEPRIRAVVSLSGWTDLNESLIPEDTAKWFWSLFLAGTANLLGTEDPVMWKWILNYLLDSNLDETRQALAARSPMTYIDDINQRPDLPPVFIMNGINDDLFTSRQIVRFYEKYRGPKKMTLANGVHGSGEMSGILFLPNPVWRDAHAWFDYWLKGVDNGITYQPPVSIYEKWAGTQGQFASWPVPGVQNTSLYLDEGNKLSTTPPAGGSPGSRQLLNRFLSVASSGVPMFSAMLWSYLKVPQLGPVPASIDSSVSSTYFETDALPRDVVVIGTPYVVFRVKPNKSEYQLNFLIYDVDESGNATLVSHQPYTCRTAAPGQTCDVRLQMNVLSHQFKAGHKIRLLVSTSDLMYSLPVLRNFKVDVFFGPSSGARLELPVAWTS